jgi:hypothetical protein
MSRNRLSNGNAGSVARSPAKRGKQDGKFYQDRSRLLKIFLFQILMI